MSSRIGAIEPPNFAFPIVTTAALRGFVSSRLPVAKVTVVCAATGYGKTTLMTALYQHARAGGVDAAWVCLDDRDTSVVNLVSRLEQSIQQAPSPLHTPSAMHESDEPIGERIDALVAELNRSAAPCVVFIDNLNYIDDDSSRWVLDALAERTGDHIHLVLAGTRMPPITAVRLKMQGRFALIDHSQLALTETEVGELLGTELTARLPNSAVPLIHRQTEGWPAAVRLMQLILCDAADPVEALASFSGSDSDLSEMLNRQLLEGLADDDRAFLLQIASLSTFSAALCEAVTGNPKATQQVEALVRRNMFVIPLDRNRQWYRLHGLFREYLQAEAARVLPAEARRATLERAARWFESEGRLSDAVEYSLAAGNMQSAAAILERVAAEFVRNRGELRSYLRWVETIKDSQTSIGWETEFWYIWGLVFYRRYEAARVEINDFAARTASAVALDETVATERARRLDILQITIGTYTDEIEQAAERSGRWLDSEGPVGDDPFDVATVACAKGVFHAAAFDFVGARRLFERARSAIVQSESDYGTAWVDTLQSMVSIAQGDFRTANHQLQSGYDAAIRMLGPSAGIVSTLALVLARCAIELGDPSRARELLDVGLKRAEHHGVVDTAAHGLDAAVKIWASDSGNGLLLSDLREIAESYPPRLSRFLSLFLVQRLLRLGRSDDAMEEAARLGIAGRNRRAATDVEIPAEDLPMMRFLVEQALLELDISGGRFREAQGRLDVLLKAAREQGRFGHATELELSGMNIAVCSVNATLAARHLTRAITFAAKRGHIRPFLDRAEIIAGLVNETKPQSWGFALDEERQFFSRLCGQLPIANSHILEQLEQLDVDTTVLENPTPRELELLALIEAGLSNQQLADRLSVSVATIKWHLYNLYAKLGVKSRAAAVAKARALNLLIR